jgi:hypothetical protein
MSIEKYEGSFSQDEIGVTQVPTKTIIMLKENSELLGFYVYLLTLPKGWNLHYRNLMESLQMSKNKVYENLNLLKNFNLLTSEEIRENGKFSRNHYRLHLRPVRPLPQNREMVEPLPQKPDPQKPDPQKPDPQNRETYITKNIHNKESEKTNITTTRLLQDSREKEVRKSVSSSVASQKEEEEIVINKEVDTLLWKSNLGHPMHAKDRKELLSWCKFFMDNLCKAPDQPGKIRTLISIFKKGGLTKPKGYVDHNDNKPVYVHEMPKTKHVSDKTVGIEYLADLKSFTFAYR